MTDRELLELAAKASGVVGVYDADLDGIVKNGCEWIPSVWRPHIDDGAALRLAVNLGLWIDANVRRTLVIVGDISGEISIESITADPCAATRRAIVRAAAEIGRSVE